VERSKKNSRAFGKRGLAVLIVVVAVLILSIPVSHMFMLIGGSEVELKKGLTLKALQLFRPPPGVPLCDDNIRDYNITGYQMVSVADIEKASNSSYLLPHVWVGAVNLNRNDANITVIYSFASLGAEGVVYRFHRVFMSLWSWDDGEHIMS
jgi:hypothetical protein